MPVQTDKEYKDSLIKNIFGSGGKAILSVVDKHGKRYSISRIQGERVNILDEVSNDLNITALSLFDGVQYFGQKDLSSSSDHENCLLEKFVSGKVGQKADVDSCVAELITAVTQLLDVGKIPAQIEETTTKKAEVEHRMSIFKEKGVDAKLKKQTGYTKDREKLIAIQAKISSVLRSLYNSYKSAPMLAEELQGFESEYNKDIFVAATNVLTSIDHQLQQIGNTIQQIQSQSIEFETVMKNLTNRIDSLADEFAEIKREINDESLDVDAFVTMTADLERYKNQLKALEEKATSRAKIEMAFKKAARERNEILLTLFKAYKTEVERINGSQNELKIQIEFKGDRETFKNQLKSDFRGTSISDAKYQVISEKFNDYVAIVEDWILNGGKEMQTIISSSEYAKLSVKLQEQYSELRKNNESIELVKILLAKAYENMKNNISPIFTKKLSENITEITDGKYKKLTFNDEQGLIVELNNGNYISAERLSTGTIDQLYLSLRLAMLDEISNEKVPIILDESFAYYDDERLKNILNYLVNEFNDRQIIIFTCSHREKDILTQENIHYNFVTI